MPEAGVLLNRNVETLDQRRAAARELRSLGPRVVIVKGGHAGGDATDIYFDGHEIVELNAPRIDTANTHGSGCAFSAAIAAGLAKGLDPLTATRAAKQFITHAIEFGLEIGRGHGPVNPMFGTQPSGSGAV
jgi:hydroxymethylpyrimidine kinase/phosphomethylpyrimidine kinase